MTKPASRLALSTIVVLAACGSRSELLSSRPLEGRDAAVDPPLTRPACLDEAELPRGAPRFTIPNIAGHPAVGRDGTIYAPTVTENNGRGLAAIDPCGRVLWRAEGWVGTPASRNITQRPYARIQDDGLVLLTNSVGANLRFGVLRYRPDGTPLGALSIERALTSFIGVPADSGPVVIAWSGEGTRHELARYSPGGVRTTVTREFPNGQECALSGSIVACWDRAFDMASGQLLWDGPANEIIDGTRRHVVGPAVDDDTVYALLYGISTYVLAARELRTGRERWRRQLLVSTEGQTGLVAGAPVIGPDGAVHVLLKLSAPDQGRLHTFSRDGELRETRRVTVGEQDFLHDATHVVDRDGTVYLAAGREVIAFAPRGEPLWRQPVEARVSRGAPVLSPFGDLYVITDRDELLALAAGSPGEARTGWPTARGGSRNRNAR